MSSFIPKPKGMCVFLPCDGEEEEWVMTVLEVTSGANNSVLGGKRDRGCHVFIYPKCVRSYKLG